MLKIVTADVISVDREIMGGRPCFRGTRVPIDILLDYLAAEHSIDDFLEQYPSITKEQAIGALDELKKTLLEVRESFTR
jgi:uncharacterized protein (DUF433 family)